MKLIEAEGKRILKEAGIAVPLVFSPEEVQSFPVYVKAQLLQGRRGQRGLVRRCENREELKQALVEMREKVRGMSCAGFICEPEVVHAAQWFVSLDIDRTTGNCRLNVSDEGGMGVSHARVIDVPKDTVLFFTEYPPAICEVINKLVDLWKKLGALSIEINPLAICADGSVVALDAKIELDDAATFRHPEWESLSKLSESSRQLSEREEAYARLLAEGGHRGTLGRYVELDGDIALILSGGGASLVAMDALKRAGGRAANYVEMSGNPDPEQVRKATAIVLSKPGIRAVWIAGSFANFTDIQATVGAVLAAILEAGLKVPVVIRRDGPNAEAAQADAARWATEHGISVRFDRADVDLDASAKAVVEASRV